MDGMNYQRQLDVAKQVRAALEATPDVVDVDDTIEAPQTRWLIAVDRARAARLGVDQTSVANAISTALAGEDTSYLHTTNAKVALPVRLELPAGEKDSLERVLAIKIRARDGNLIALSEVTQVIESQRQQTIHHKDLLPVVYVLGDVAGETDSPLYGLAAIYKRIEETPVDGQVIDQFLNSQPDNPVNWSLKWDGELQVTLDTFRDMGIAYSVGLIMIYLLVVGML